MDNIIGIIIFLIISSIVSGGKNKKKNKRSENPSEIKTFMDDVKESIQIGMENRRNPSQSLDEKGLKNKKKTKDDYRKKTDTKYNSSNSKPKKQNQKNEIYRTINNNQENEKEYQTEDIYEIEDMYFSGNRNSNEKNIRNIQEDKKRNRLSPYSNEGKHERERIFSDKEDIQRAIILKEILDKPLSLRK